MTTDDQNRRTDDRPIDAAEDRDPRIGALDPDVAGRDGERGRTEGLPEHEIDDDRTTGGGILSEGGTAVDRGTGELGGQAQGERAGSDQDPDFLADEADAALGHDQRAIR